MTRSLFDLTGRIALVTGAAHGLGRAIALGLARHGAAVALADLDADAAEEVAQAIRAHGGKALVYPCDIGREDDVRLLVTGVLAEFAAIDILVNNAGITRHLPLFDWKEADWEVVIRVNLTGTFLVAREVGRHMIARRRGSIINLSALAGAIVGLGHGNAIYGATKGAVAALTRDLAAEWAPYGVRVNCIAPGWFRTEMTAPPPADPHLSQRVIERVPLGRFGEPEDVVGPVVFLASDASAMVTGHLLPVDGGASAVISLTTEAAQ